MKNFLKGQTEIIADIIKTMNDDNFMDIMKKRDIEKRLDIYGKGVELDLFLTKEKKLIIQYYIIRPTILECRLIVKRIKKDFSNHFDGKCEMILEMEGKQYDENI